MPTYLKYKYIFFFILISGRIRIRNIFPAEPDPDPRKKMSDPHPWLYEQFVRGEVRDGSPHLPAVGQGLLVHLPLGPGVLPLGSSKHTNLSITSIVSPRTGQLLHCRKTTNGDGIICK